MIKVELDIFSGRQNPSWILSGAEENELFERIQGEPNLVQPVAATSGKLGYRGYILTVLNESIERRLPSAFRIGGDREIDRTTSLWLLNTSEVADTEVDDFLREAASGAILKAGNEGASVAAPPSPGAGMSCASTYLTSSTDFSFWNGAGYITNNNCYNYASNLRNNTFAQPGNHSGNIFTVYSCSNVAAACRSDGWYDTCRTSNNLCICLVIWPGEDFHFFRKCSGGKWCHKPGNTAAKNTDDSNNIITNPETCNRGPYTSFCEYFFVTNGLIQVS